MLIIYCISDSDSGQNKKTFGSDMIGESGVKAVTDAYASGSEIPPPINWSRIPESSLCTEDSSALSALKYENVVYHLTVYHFFDTNISHY